MADTILQIRPVTREQTKLVVMLAGRSGDGKTRSALELAHGLTDFNPGKIGFLCCENRRGALEFDVFPTPFLFAELPPPFSPARYIQAMREFAESGVEVLIIDSVTHEWEGEGGCQDIADRALLNGKKVKDWVGAKRAHKQFVNTLLFLPMHIIACVRAREKTDMSNPTAPVSEGIQPIQEKNFLFEATFSFLLDNRGETRHIIKLAKRFESLVGTDGYLTSQHGKNLRDWIGGFDALEMAKGTLRLGASKGSESLRAAWEALPAKQKPALAAFKDTLKDLAKHSDEEWLQDQRNIQEKEAAGVTQDETIGH